VGLPLAVHAQEQCPDMLAAQGITPGDAAPTAGPPTPDDAPFDVEAENAVIDVNGTTQLKGAVRVRRGDSEIRADNVEYRESDSALKVEGNVEFEDPLVHATGGGGSYSATEGATFRDAEFELRQRSARGSADNMQMTPDGLIKLNKVRFTTCPRDDSSWQLLASNITLDTRTRVGTGRSTRVDFKGVPILYLPWMSFPLGAERKSGFLFPTAGHSTRSGYQFALPYYWNIAPNADLTFEPTYYSQRGLDWAGETRFLSEHTKTSLQFSYLPNDSVLDRDRNRFYLRNLSKLPNDVRFFIDAETVSDPQYFEDFAQGPEGTSVSFVERLAGFGYRDEHWRMSAEFQQFQTINQDVTQLAEIDRPYARLPRITLNADYGWGPQERLRYGFDSEVVNFDRDVGVTGWRFDAMPGASLDFGSPSLFMRPGVAFRYTEYSLEETAPDQRKNPTRSLPIASFDAGMVFEREAGSRGQRRQTLEPRLLYLNVPYRDQDDLPLFDTGVPNLSLVQLFRTNRYVGADRVSDADQVSLGVTSRLFDTDSGTQFLSMTLGQIYYFKQPQVLLPEELSRDSHTSDFVGQVSLTAYKNWNADFGLQWNPDQSQYERAQANLQFKPAGEQVINLGYRFQRDLLEQAEISGAWPIGQRWNIFTRYVYSMRDDKALERFAGVEYRACCWRVRAVGRKFVSSRTGDEDTGIYLQLELTGLASVGSAADAFLTGAIRGYERLETPR
jgi:LPS-assembly protein